MSFKWWKEGGHASHTVNLVGSVRIEESVNPRAQRAPKPKSVAGPGAGGR